jgi:response regulator of citrate/malate metabolism
VTSQARRWNVLVVEDDATIASVYCRIVVSTPPFQVAGIVARGEDALEWLKVRPADLMLLDLKLAGMSGLRLIQSLRGFGHTIEVIAVTADRSASTVQAVVHAGAIDYLVKPFPPDRLRQSLGRFVHRVSAASATEVDQAQADEICGSGREAKPRLPKGLTEEAVVSVRQSLRSSGERSALDVAQHTGLARVTARRYLEYLVSTGQATTESRASRPGRPRKLYRWRDLGETP